MDSTNPAVTAAASNPPIDAAALAKTISDSVASALSESLKPFHERLGKLEAPASEPKPNDKAAGRNLTAEDVGKIVGDQLSAHQKNQAKREARDRHASAKMRDVPAVYLRDLPETEDQAELDKAEQTIRNRYREDLKSIGAKAPDVGGAAAAGTQPPISAGRVDVSKMTSQQKIEGLIASSIPSMHGTIREAAAAEGRPQN